MAGAETRFPRQLGIDVGGGHVLYQWYELSRAAMRPARIMAGSGRLIFNNPFNPLAYTVSGRHAAAACEVFERTTRRYKKPSSGWSPPDVDGVT